MPEIAMFDSYLILFARERSLIEKKPKAGKMPYNLQMNDISETFQIYRENVYKN